MELPLCLSQLNCLHQIHHDLVFLRLLLCEFLKFQFSFCFHFHHQFLHIHDYIMVYHIVIFGMILVNLDNSNFSIILLSFEISQFVARPAFTAYSTTFSFNTGNVPGIAIHIGQTWVFGSAPNVVGHEQNIFVLLKALHELPILLLLHNLLLPLFYPSFKLRFIFLSKFIFLFKTICCI